MKAGGVKHKFEVEVVRSNISGQTDDLFLCCTSFESRCSAAAQRLSDGYRVRLSCIFRFMPSDTDEPGFDEARDKNAAKLANILAKKTTEFAPVTIMCDKHDVDDGAEQLTRILDIHFPEGCKTVTIDMSSFTKIYFWELMSLLVIRLGIRRIQVLYTQSKSIPSDALTGGAFPPLLIPQFAGRLSPVRRTLLLGFVGFEPQRAILIYEEFEPERAELFVSFNPDREQYYSRAIRANEYLLTRPGVRWSRVHPYDLDEIAKVLQSVLEASQDHVDLKNIILMSLGTKVQNLASFLFWFQHREIRLAYAFPTKYAKDHLRLQPGATFSFRLGPEVFGGIGHLGTRAAAT